MAMSIALVAFVLVAGAVVISYLAGCGQNGAGSTAASVGHQLVSVWLMLPGLSLFAALFAAPVGASLPRTVLRAVGSLLVASPVAIGVLLYAESAGDEQSTSCAVRAAL
ncbi:hypothetical protein GCM10007918_17150 [Piscinibacter gummiphilus]|nr:hypothetical protein GCM10007918_17150 [Piscinibacter gummiphilus]